MTTFKSIISNLNKRNNKQLLVHIVIWLVFLTISLFNIYLGNGNIPYGIIIVLGSNLLLFYINYSYLVPKFLLQKNQKLYFTTAAVLIVVFALFQIMGTPSKPPMVSEYFEGPPPPRMPFMFFVPVLINLSFVVIGTSIKIYAEWNRNEINKKEIENQKSKTELHFLKHQLSPHFLFNSLNSIYSLSTKKSPNTPEAIITLSELMRYMLYQTDSELVTLKEELEYIQNYLKLQRLRIANNENVVLNINGPVATQKITPLLLISFIENAFKYGTDLRGNTEIKIRIKVQQDKLEFTCVNFIGHRRDSSESSGIGLINTKERLKLLYPGKHFLKVEEEQNRFVVNLTLELDP